MLTKGKYVRVSLDLPKDEYRRLNTLTTSRGWSKAFFLRIVTISAVAAVESTEEIIDQDDLTEWLRKVT
jgi:predicted DNA-binding protein